MNTVERTKEISMSCSLTDKNLEALTGGDKDAVEMLTKSGSSGLGASKDAVKDEMPSLPQIHSELKLLKRTYLLHT
jgi:hypothetical protein